MALAHALERLWDAVRPGSDAGRGRDRERLSVPTRDLIELLEDHQRIDAQLRAAHFHANRPAYPPRVDMLARAASDPGLYAGPRGDRTMGGWIADAILALEHQQAPEEIRRLAKRMLDVGREYRAHRHAKGAYALEEGAAELTQQSGRIERLRRILARYGDRVPMAMCHRADWQQEIDEALEWVARHPEPLEGVHHNLAPADAAKLDGFIRGELGRDDPALGRESTLRPGFYEGDME